MALSPIINLPQLHYGSVVLALNLVFYDDYLVPPIITQGAKDRGLNRYLHIFGHFGQYLRTRCIFVDTDFWVETMNSSWSF